jgi:DNA-binding NarL/FixJ family response regulator
MASESCAAIGERQEVLAMFRAGRSKADIARELGKDKKAVGKIIAKAMRAKEGARGSAR